VANTSVDGLISGLSTSTIISQLMQIEAQPQNRLKSQVSSEQSVVSAYQAINTAMKAALDQAKSLDTASDWKLYSASSSAASVSVTAATTAQPGTYSFDVKTLAKPHAVLYSTAASSSAVVAPSGSIMITPQGGAAVTVSVGTGKLQEVVDGINSAKDLNVRAGLIKMADDSYRLQLTSKTTGEAAQFTVGGLDATLLGTADPTSVGTDATIQIGPNAVTDTVHSSTNTFSGVFPGVTFTATKENETGVTVTVGTDTNGLSTRIKGLVDAVNGVISEITKDTAYHAARKSGGPLLGQLLPTQLQSALSNTVTADKTSTLAAVGIQLDRNGKVTLDQTKLTAALQADPATVQNLVTGFATRVVAVADAATNAKGSVTSVIAGRQAFIKTLNDQIDDWDTRLTMRQDALKKQYASLETALGQLQSQGNWLAGQISSLPTGDA
jgi:flagellar hook-associated protein 2